MCTDYTRRSRVKEAEKGKGRAELAVCPGCESERENGVSVRVTDQWRGETA